MSKLAQACELSFNDWLATFPDVIPEAERSKRHDRWKKNLFDKMRDDHYHIFTTKTIKVMWIAAIISMMLLTAFVIPSSREYILDNLDEFSRYKITENNKNSVAGEITVGYIPDGFELENFEFFSKHVTFKYSSEDGKFFTIFKYASSMEVNFDTENYVSEEFVVDSIKYIYCQGNDSVNNLIWIKNDYVYKLDATFEKEELIKIAKTVE